jgi:hypothetical protein
MDQTQTQKRPRTTLIAFVMAGVLALVAAAALGALLAADDDEDSAPTATFAAPATSAEPDDVPIGTAEQRRIEAAALALTGPGAVTEIDRSDDAGEAYEVEVLTDAGEVDVALDDNLRRVPNLRYDELDDDGL